MSATGKGCLLAATLVLTGCAGTTPLGHDYDEEFDVVVAFCTERIHIDETCSPIEDSSGEMIYSYALFGNVGGHTIRVTRDVIKGGSAHQESEPRLVAVGQRRLDGASITREEACLDANCKIVIRAFVDDDEVAKAGFSFVGR